MKEMFYLSQRLQDDKNANCVVQARGRNGHATTIVYGIPEVQDSYKVVQLATMSMPYSIVLAMNTDYDMDAVPFLVSPFYSLSLS